MTLTSSYVTYTISCDYPGCPAQRMHSMKTCRDFLDECRVKGWIMLTNGNDYCPQHRKIVEEQLEDLGTDYLPGYEPNTQTKPKKA